MTSHATNLTRSSPNALASSSSVLFPTLIQKIQSFLFVSNTVAKGNEMTVRKPFDTMLPMGIERQIFSSPYKGQFLPLASVPAGSHLKGRQALQPQEDLQQRPCKFSMIKVLVDF